MTLAAGWSSSVLFVLGACASSTLLPAGPAIAPPAAAAPSSAVPASPPAQGRAPAPRTADLLAQLGRAETETTAEALIALRSRAASLSPDERQQASQAAQTLVERLTTEAATSAKTLPAALALLVAMGTHEATPKLVALLRYRLLEDQQLDKEEHGAQSLLAHTVDPQRTARRERLRTEGEAAMDALGQLGAPAAGAALAEGVLAFSYDTGALALARIREPEVTPTLLRILSGQLFIGSSFIDPALPRTHAVQLLGTLRPADGVAPLTAFLADRKQSISLREEAGKALALYVLTAPNRWTQIETALVQFADSTRPDQRQFNLRNQFQFYQLAECPSNGAWWGYVAGAEDTYWTLLAAAPALGLAGGRQAIVRLRRALLTKELQGQPQLMQRLAVMYALALAARHADLPELDAALRLTEKQLVPADGAPECERRSLEGVRERVRRIAQMAELGRQCDGDWRCYERALLSTDAAVARKAALLLARTAGESQRAAAMQALFAALESPASVPHANAFFQDDLGLQPHGWLVLALAALFPQGCADCTQRLSALLHSPQGQQWPAYMRIDAENLLSHWPPLRGLGQ